MVRKWGWDCLVNVDEDDDDCIDDELVIVFIVDCCSDVINTLLTLTMSICSN